MPRQGDEMPTQREITPGVGRWTWGDGTPLTQDEVNELGLTNAGNAGNFFDDVGVAVGFNPQEITTRAPGATLDTSGSDLQRQRHQDFLARMQQQATTGDGAWRGQFQRAVQSSLANASAVGQSDPGVDYGTALDNIGNAQSSIKQRAAGEEDMLRTQSKLDARRQMADSLGGQAQMDIAQASEEARIARERGAANQALHDQSGENREKTEKSITSMFGMMGGMSDGGEVPGRAQVMGNDETNDTVPAMLSPKEIVIPRDIAMSADAPERAAAFVRAVKAGYDPQANGGNPRKLAEGGSAGSAGGGNETGISRGSAGRLAEKGGYAGYLLGPQVGRSVQYGAMRGMMDKDVGAVIDEGQFRQTAAQQNALASLFEGQAAGTGPSLAPQLQQKALDQNIAAQMQASSRGATSNDAMQAGAAANVEGAAGSARQAGREQSEGQSAFSRAVQQQRGQQMQLASAQQQAGWGATLNNMNLSLEKQAQIRGAMAGAGQAGAAFAGMGQGGGKNNTPSWRDPDGASADEFGGRGGAGDLGHGDSGGGWDEGSDPSEWENPYAFGGIVGMADGGLVARGPNGERLETDKQAAEREAAERRKRIYRDESWKEETDGDEMPKREKSKAKESAFARAVRMAQKFGASVGGMAEGGTVDPYALPPRRDSGPMPVDASGYPMSFAPPNFTPGPALDAGTPAMMPVSHEPASMTPAKPLADKLFSPSVAGAFKAPPGYDPVLGPGLSAPLAAAVQDNAPLPSGVKPKGAGIPAPSPEGTPPVEPKPKGAGGIRVPSGVAPNEAALSAEEQAALDASVAADAAKAQAEVAGAKAKADATEAAMLQRKETEARVKQDVADARAKFDAAQAEMSRVDTSVDPGRFWATRTTEQKVVGIIGLIFGALGAGPDGINRAAVMLNQSIDRDLEAQKAEHTLRLQKGKQASDAAQTYYAMARQAANDDLAAIDWARAAALDAAAAKAEQMVAATGDQRAKANGQMLAVSLRRAAAERVTAGEQRVFDNRLKAQHLANETMAAGAKAAGGHLPAAEQSKAIEVKERTANIRRSIAQAEALIDKAGTMEVFGTEQTELQRLLGDIAQDSARLKDPNSTVKEQELINAKKAIGLEGGEFFTRNSVAKKLLRSYLATMEDREAEALRVRGLR